ncbi:MAG TPA: NAD(P)/FAD-dependent oxidoreductase [Burkholderiales bacterium]|nr:NAD(P)/FAD-dependent oxidoreductase [Burkholderiales bacterium]
MIYDFAILGAGAAGLAAAAELARHGKSAVILEARDRIGGRVWSLEVPGLPVPVELGAEFIHGRPPATLERMRRAGIAAVDAPVVRRAVVNGKLEPRGDGLYMEVQRALRRYAGTLRRRDVSFQTFLARARHGLSAEAQVFARMRVQGYDAADPARASARAIAEEWSAEAAASGGHFRVQGGYGALLAAIARSLQGSRVELRLRSVVRAVRWKRGAVEVEGTCPRDEGGGTRDEGGRSAKRSPPAGEGVAHEVRRGGGSDFLVTARRAIITLPLGVLKAPARAPGAVRFTPPLKEKRAALAGLASGSVAKAALLFRTAFWEQLDDARYRGVSFFHSPRARFPTYWTALPEPVPLLVAWAGGPNAERLAKAATPAVVREAAASFASIFPLRSDLEEHLAAAWFHHWQQDPFARGAYSYVTVGGHGARQALAEPLHDTLFFAGEAADDEGEHGTVAGALQSGERAAREAAGG